MVLSKEGESVGSYPVSDKARDAYCSEQANTNFPLNFIKGFIEQLPSKEFTQEEQDVIEGEFPYLYQSNND